MPRPLAAALALTLLSCLAAGTAEAQRAQTETVRCPVESLTSGITTKLPEGWTGQPVTGRLENTVVRAQGDALDLVCRYGAAGAISLRMPARYETCAPASGGFTCALLRDGRFAARGVATVARRHGFDLDTGKEQADRRLNDIWFTGLAGGMPVIESFNNTTFYVLPLDRPDVIRSCQEGEYEPLQLAVGRNVEIGQSVCYQTEQGRFGLLTIRDAGQTALDIQYRTRK